MGMKSIWNKLFHRKKVEVSKKNKIGLALSGGGARGFGHIGAIKAFEENGITFDVIAGTSVGSLVGAMWAQGFTASQMTEIGLNLKEKDIRSSKIPFVPSKTERLESFVKKTLGEVDIQDLKIPFSAIAVDLISGEEVVFTEGPVVKILPASCAVPTVFDPVEYGGMRLVDGGLSNTIPADILKMAGCDIVVSVDINKTRGQGTSSKKYFDIIMASIRILMKANAVKGKIASDVLIEPDLKRFSASKLDGAQEMIDEGYKATKEKIPEILALLKASSTITPKKAKKIKEHKKAYSKDKMLDLDEEIEIFDKSLE